MSEKNSEEEEKFLRKRGKSTIAPKPLELELRCVLGDWRGQRAREIETPENGLFPVLTKIQAKKTSNKYRSVKIRQLKYPSAEIEILFKFRISIISIFQER